ncbi:MAG: hypothetical protein ACI4XB_05860 [Ruminococcus sp.]
MAPKVQEIAKLAEMLSESDQDFAYEFLKKLVLAWDPDFRKSTAEEVQHMKDAENSGYPEGSEIDWAHLGEMDLD